jgi:hypothetical protein
MLARPKDETFKGRGIKNIYILQSVNFYHVGPYKSTLVKLQKLYWFMNKKMLTSKKFLFYNGLTLDLKN